MLPTFSIIVPVYEQWHHVPQLLKGLVCQNPEAERFELLLIDNGSLNFQPPPNLPAWARILNCERPGSYAARNMGLEAASGRWLVFTDADCVPAPGWLDAFDRYVGLLGAEDALFAGAVYMTVDEGPLNPYQIYDLVKGIPQAWYVRRGYGATANLCIPRHVIECIGPFDERLYSGGDAELCRRARDRGYRIAYLPEAIVEHPARDTWSALVTKARRVKGGQLTAGSIRWRALGFARSFTPPVFATVQFLAKRHLPRRFRFIAILVQLGIWMVDMHEALRIAVGMEPERR